MKRLRVHSSRSADGRLFVQFIALIYLSALRKKMRDSRLLERYTVRGLLFEMETLTKIKYSGRYGHVLTEVTKQQRQILNDLGMEIPC
jgi:Transposase